MPGFLLHLNAQVICGHGGQAVPMAPQPRVLVSGQPITTMPRPYLVGGCPNLPPCMMAQWITGATRVTALAEPVLLFDSQAITAPNGAPLIVLSTQTRVQGT